MKCCETFRVSSFFFINCFVQHFGKGTVPQCISGEQASWNLYPNSTRLLTRWAEQNKAKSGETLLKQVHCISCMREIWNWSISEPVCVCVWWILNVCVLVIDGYKLCFKWHYLVVNHLLWLNYLSIKIPDRLELFFGIILPAWYYSVYYMILLPSFSSSLNHCWCYQWNKVIIHLNTKACYTKCRFNWIKTE